MNKTLAGVLIAFVFIAGGAVAQRADAFSLQDFVTQFVEEGFIAKQKEAVARLVARFFGERGAPAPAEPAPETEPARNAESVEVSLSKRIEFSNKTFAEGEPIQGLLLLTKNIGTSTIEVTGRAKCHVSYRILPEAGDTVLYDSAAHEPCTGEDTSFYYLAPGQTRMYEVTHAPETHTLAPGTYRFDISFPGYGGGELTVSVE